MTSLPSWLVSASLIISSISSSVRGSPMVVKTWRSSWRDTVPVPLSNILKVSVSSSLIFSSTCFCLAINSKNFSLSISFDPKSLIIADNSAFVGFTPDHKIQFHQTLNISKIKYFHNSNNKHI
eukprot:TRINITY_DN4336_c0_g1_i1.p1 TRINITY_DN4336_c0_g1~~TRINITY_DN4336_c0_g1_i1.p1  ORF type:complete len:123 (+),score=0.45 TRINITY_DN4336_c0_g1_i1:60-428(+)